jgi:hypothetical protein
MILSKDTILCRHTDKQSDLAVSILLRGSAVLILKRQYSLYWQISVILAQMYKTFTGQILDTVQLF